MSVKILDFSKWKLKICCSARICNKLNSGLIHFAKPHHNQVKQPQNFKLIQGTWNQNLVTMETQSVNHGLGQVAKHTKHSNQQRTLKHWEMLHAFTLQGGFPNTCTQADNLCHSTDCLLFFFLYLLLILTSSSRPLFQADGWMFHRDGWMDPLSQCCGPAVTCSGPGSWKRCVAPAQEDSHLHMTTKGYKMKSVPE